MNQLDTKENNLITQKNAQMVLTVPFFQDISLQIGPVQTNDEYYPSSDLQKGLILISDGQKLVEEGVGFGVPVLMQGVKTIFAGEKELNWVNDGLTVEITSTYHMNLEEKLAYKESGTIQSSSLYKIKNHLEGIYRRFPISRSVLMILSNKLRSGFGWQTTYVEAECNYKVQAIYFVDSKNKTITVTVDFSDVPIKAVTEFIVMNEQGAHFFDMYSDSNGLLLEGEAIGSWEEVTSKSASFHSRDHGVVFSLHQISGARLYRGREIANERLAWSGFGYSLPPSNQKLTYTLGIERVT